MLFSLSFGKSLFLLNDFGLPVEIIPSHVESKIQNPQSKIKIKKAVNSDSPLFFTIE